MIPLFSKRIMTRALVALGILILFSLALHFLRTQLNAYKFNDIRKAAGGVSHLKVLSAMGLTVLSYFLLTGYDLLAQAFLRKKLVYAKTALASFLGYVFSYNIGLSVIGGGSVRLRLYTQWGLSPTEVGKLIAFCALTFWLGLFVLCGVLFTVAPTPLPQFAHIIFSTTQPLGILLLFLFASYLALVCFHAKKPVVFGSRALRLPDLGFTLRQVALGFIDIVVAGSVLYALLPDDIALSFGSFLGIYALGLFLGLVSHVPGGVGVFETVMFLFLGTPVNGAELLAALLLYRLIYYFAPFVLALVMYGLFEAFINRKPLTRMTRASAKFVSVLTPNILAVGTFVAGTVLLFSGATPSIKGRLHLIDDLLPLPMVEASHFAGSVIGVVLLVLSRAISRRVNVAYYVTLGVLAIGIPSCLIKGLDYEEATVLALLFASMLPARKYFHRHASVLGQQLTLEWTVTTAIVVITTLWLGFFSYKHVEYGPDLWWTFSMMKEAPRFMRSSVGTAVLLLALALWRLLRAAPEPFREPDSQELALAAKIALSSERTLALLSQVGDKRLLFNEEKSAFIMYRVEGRCFVSLGDPVGPTTEWVDLLWKFREIGDRHGGYPIFYQVQPDTLPFYVDLGLVFTKLGDEAIVDLTQFVLEGNMRKSLRQAYARAKKGGLIFTIIPKEEVPGKVGILRAISDNWLLGKNAREKGFSVGYYTDEYIKQADIILISDASGKACGFANLLVTAKKHEFSIDLMRFTQDAPYGVMDFLFTELMLWGKREGYQTFNLGMAPFSGMEAHPLTPAFHKFAVFVFKHGEYFYNFQGVRSYKEKFKPDWQPRYIAYPRDASLPIVLTNIVAFISRGIKGVVTK